MAVDGAALVAQISDLHIVERGAELAPGLDTASYTSAAVAHLNELDPAPDLVLVTGDLVNDGRPEQYAHLRELLEPLALPYRLMPGNHDDPVALSRALGDQVVGAHKRRLDGLLDLGELRVVCLDSSRGPLPGGQLDEVQLEWLAGTLEDAPDTDTVIAVHHPPFSTGIGHMDAMALDAPSSAALAEIVWKHTNVERVLCGHLHRTIVRRWAGTVAMTAPSVAHAVALGLDGGAAAWNLEPPAIALHLWRRGEGVVTHVQAIGDYETHPF